ncbi:MAG TPA: methyl-accepting chemotaxis protein [Cellulomonas sp.]
MSVSGKIMSLVALAAVVTAGLGIYASTTISQVRADTARVAAVQSDVVTPLTALKDALWNVRLAVTAAGAYPPDAKQKPVDQLTAAYGTLDQAVTSFHQAYGDALGGEPASWGSFTSALSSYRQAVDTQLMPAAKADDRAQWVTLRDGGVAQLGSQMISDLTAVDSDVTTAVGDVATATERAARTAIVTTIIVIVLGILATTAVGIVIASAIRRSVAQVKRSVDAIARGDLTVVPEVNSADEVGDMARGLAAALVSLRELVGGVMQSASTVAASSEELSAAGAQVAAGSEETSTQAGVVAAAAEQVSRNVQSVAAGAEQMGASIREIARSATDAARVAAHAAQVAASATEQVSRLGTSSQQIGEVVKVITTIAEQTNLLSLNATIEAARAGESGKGFAVVAGEVKDLARETAKATEDIARRVEAIQADTGGAVAAIDRITEIITEINDHQTTIASAVEEQTATTNEMSRSVAEAAQGAGEIAGNITGVAVAARTTSEALEQVEESTRGLAELAIGLQGRVAAFAV